MKGPHCKIKYVKFKFSDFTIKVFVGAYDHDTCKIADVFKLPQFKMT